MKKISVLAGFILGLGGGIFLTTIFMSQNLHANQLSKNVYSNEPWPDSLDAVVADPANHKIVFENEKVRILEVVGGPYAVETIHTHRWPSIMWVADSAFGRGKMISYQYGYDNSKKSFYLKDSVIQHAPPANRGFQIPPEGPHRVISFSSAPLIAYRVEFKN